MFEVVNRSDLWGNLKANQVWVDRKSPLGNPYPMSDKNDDQERTEVIAKYRKWLWKKMQTNSKQLNELRRLLQLEATHGKVYLLCWCKPKPCHGDVLVKALAWLKYR